MTKLEALKELENQAETLQKTLEEIRAMIVAEESPPKPNLIGVPLREAPSCGTEYWLVSGDGICPSIDWRADAFDKKRLISGNVFATKEDAEFAAKRRAIFAHPIGEWSDTEAPISIWIDATVGRSARLNWSERDLYLCWLEGRVAFDEDGRVELERRVAAWEKLCKEYGIA